MRKSMFIALSSVIGIASIEIAFADADNSGCPADSVEVGSWCVDRFEASTWETTHKGLIQRIKKGVIRFPGALTKNAIRRGEATDDYSDAGCPDSGNGCTDVYAVSVKGVLPSTFITWMQATAACRNSGKELLPNSIWQAAALGTPDPGVNGDGMNTCATNTIGPVPTGTTGDCVSDEGAFDMVGNVEELVADWAAATGNCAASLFGSSDFNCYSAVGPARDAGPRVIFRGGGFNNRAAAGVFATIAIRDPGTRENHLGFRCGRMKVTTSP